MPGRRFALALALAFALLGQRVARADEPRSVPDPWTAVPTVVGTPGPTVHHRDYRAVAAAGTLGFYVGVGSWAYFAWYFHHSHHGFVAGGDGWLGDTTYAGGADKFGHAWANYGGTRLGYHALRAGGWGKVPALAISAGLSAAFFTLVEVKDGFFYQFSYSDETGNLLGVALGVAMETWPTLDRLFDYKVEYWPSAAYLKILGGAPGADINALNFAEDYSGETYLFATHVGEIGHLADHPSWGWTRYLDATIGFGSRDYKPDVKNMPNCPHANPLCETQNLTIGVAFNLQAVVDRYTTGTWRKIGHAFFEGMQLPFTAVQAVGIHHHPSTDPDPSTSSRQAP